MPKFMTVSPTHVPGKKEYAWNKFRDGNYVAIGWLHDYDLTGKSLDEVIALIREQNYDNEASGIDAFTKFLALEIGDYVAVNNTNDGLFGIGVISSGYKYERYKHDTGSDDREDFYPHFRDVQWKYTSYVRRKDIISTGEVGWKPFGTVGNLEKEVPPYIQRLLGILPSKRQVPPKSIAPEYLKSVMEAVERLRSDPNHQERAHESLVEDFLHALGYEKHRDIRYRQGRVDVSLWDRDKVLVIIEVKKDWNLSLYNSPDAVQQAYKYALDHGARWVMLTNGDYYAVFDRLKGLSLSSNLIGEFRLTALGESDVDLIKRLSRDSLLKPNIEELFRRLSECF
jgi:Holliday junction resolvase-like predicted endonuclease